MSPAEQLRAIADESDNEAVRLATSPICVGVMADPHHAPTRDEMLEIGQRRTVALVKHYRGRAQLFRRCAEAAERIDAQ